MMTLIAAAALAVQTPAPTPADPMAQHAQHAQHQQGHPAEHKDCCKNCCKDMANKHEGHGERGGHGAK